MSAFGPIAVVNDKLRSPSWTGGRTWGGVREPWDTISSENEQGNVAWCFYVPGQGKAPRMVAGLTLLT